MEKEKVFEVREGVAAGGGRGVFAAVDLVPGQLVLRERPLITVPADKKEMETLHMALARAVLAHPKRSEVLSSITAVLHPRHLSDLELHVLQTVRTQHAGDITVLQEQLKGSGIADGQGSDEDALLQLLLALRFNAHYSGLYLTSEMFNHSCCPNAVKLAVRGGVSEIRAVRRVAAGEEVTISYLNPWLQSFTRRCAALQEQHFFKPITSPFPPEAEAFLCGAMEGSSSQQQLEDQLDGIELELDRLEAQLHRLQRQKQQAQATAAGLTPLAALLADACAQRRHAASLLGPRHITLARIHDLIINVGTDLLGQQSSRGGRSTRAPAGAGGAGGATAQGGASGDGGPGAAGEPPMLDLTFGATSVGFEYVAPPKPPARANAQSQHQQQQQPLAQKPAGDSPAQLPAAAGPQNPGPVVVPEEGSGPQVALLLMRSGLELLTTLELCCGQDHHDVARVLLDLQAAIEYLLSCDPKLLYSASPGLNFSKASTAAASLYRRHKALAAAYAAG